MADFSFRRATFAGFGVMRARPTALIYWALFAIAFEMAQRVGEFLLAGHSQARLDAITTVQTGWGLGASILSLPDQALVMAPQLVLIAVFAAAMNRAVQRPSESAFGYIRFGADELKQLGTVALLYLLVFGINLGVTSALDALWRTTKQSSMQGVDSVVSFGVWLVVLVRLSLSPAATFRAGRMNLSDSWRLTKGRFWPVVGSWAVAWMIALAITVVWAMAAYRVADLFSGGNAGPLHDDLSSLTAFLSTARLRWIALQEPSTALFWVIVLAPLAAIHQQLAGRGEVEAAAAQTTGVPEAPASGGSFRAVIESNFVEKTLEVGAGAYRARWLRLAKRAGVLDREISDEGALNAVRWTRSFNGAAFSVSIFWMAYRNIRHAWIIIATFFVAAELIGLLPDALSDRVGSLFGLVVVTVSALFGDGWLLATVMRERSRNGGTIVVHRSRGRVYLVLLIVVLLMVGDAAIEPYLPAGARP